MSKHQRILATRGSKVPRRPARGQPRAEAARALVSPADFWDYQGLPWPIDDLAMTTRQLLIGCVFALGGISAAGAMEVDTQDLASGQHAAVDVSASHEAGGSNNDALLPPACHIGCSSDAAGDSSTGSNETAPSGVTAHPHNGHRASLGWQSLLPGSIQ